jgi:hypothetical protein
VQQQIHLIDQTWIDAPVRAVAAVVADCANWRRWWPGLELTVTRDRKDKGIQWSARPGPVDHSGRRGFARPDRGGFVGTVEIWLEPHRDGVILHHFLRLDPVGGRLSDRAAAAVTRRLAWHAKRVFWQLKDELEAGRP